MIVVMLAALLVGVSADTTPISSMTVFVSDPSVKPGSPPVLTPFNTQDILSKPILIVAKTLPRDGIYKASLLEYGMNGYDSKDERYKDVNNKIRSMGDKYALFLDLKAFYHERLFGAQIDEFIVPESFKVHTYGKPDPPILFITDTADFMRYRFPGLREVAKYSIYPNIVKLLS